MNVQRGDGGRRRPRRSQPESLARRLCSGRALGRSREDPWPTSPRATSPSCSSSASEDPNGEAFRYPSTAAGGASSWRETEERVRAIAGGLRALGVAPEQAARSSRRRGSSGSSPISASSAPAARPARSTLHPPPTSARSSSPTRARWWPSPRTTEQVAKLARAAPSCRRSGRWSRSTGPARADGWVLTLAELEAQGRAWDAAHPGAFEERAGAGPRRRARDRSSTPRGTTGRPKGVELTHAAWVTQSKAVEDSGILDHPDCLQFFWLPLAHVVREDDRDGAAPRRLPDRGGRPRSRRSSRTWATSGPTFVCAVPRIFEKVHAKVLAERARGRAR